MPFSSQLDACSTSMSCETNLLKENNKFKREVKNLLAKIERCYNSKVTFEHILKNQRHYGKKHGLGFKGGLTKKERKRKKKEEKMEKQQQLKGTSCKWLSKQREGSTKAKSYVREVTPTSSQDQP